MYAPKQLLPQSDYDEKIVKYLRDEWQNIGNYWIVQKESWKNNKIEFSFYVGISIKIVFQGQQDV